MIPIFVAIAKTVATVAITEVARQSIDRINDQ